MAIECLKEYGICTEHTDSMAMAWFDGKIQAIGGAVQAVTASNLHQVYDTSGNLLYRYTAPFTADSEMLVSYVKSGKLVVLGQLNQQEIWEFDPTIAGYTSSSWTQITSDFTPDIGVRKMAVGGDLSGWFYILGGWEGTDVYRTQDFVNWTFVDNLPAAINRVSGPGFCVHDGHIYMAGGATRLASPYGLTEFYAAERLGHLYKFDGTTFTAITTSAANFGHIWGDLVSDGTNLWYAKGYLVNTNERGLLKSTDDGANWSAVTPLNDGLCWFVESHRRGALSTSGAGYYFGGNFVNDAWKVS